LYLKRFGREFLLKAKQKKKKPVDAAEKNRGKREKVLAPQKAPASGRRNVYQRDPGRPLGLGKRLSGESIVCEKTTVSWRTEKCLRWDKRGTSAR